MWNRAAVRIRRIALASLPLLAQAGLERHAGAQTSCTPSFEHTFGGPSFSGPGFDPTVNALAVFDDGHGPALHAAGAFLVEGSAVLNGIARWNGTSWTALDGGMSATSGLRVSALAVFDDGSGAGPALYAGGNFTQAGGVSANCIARWDGSSWTALGSGMNDSVLSLAVFDDGSGPALFAGGSFSTAGGVPASRVAKWDGVSWHALGSGTNTRVAALTVFDDGSGSALFAGGSFSIAGGVAASRIAKWDGANWHALGSGVSGGPFGSSVLALQAHDDGSGPALFVGGDFTSAGGATALRIARWNGTSWSPLGSGVNQNSFGNTVSVFSLAVLDDGSGGGPTLYLGGNFQHAGSSNAWGVARWNGSTLEPLQNGSPTPITFNSLAVFDDGLGGGPALYGGGYLDADFYAYRVSRWTGSNWLPLRGLNAPVRAQTVFDDGSGDGPALVVGGDFRLQGGLATSRIARWDGARWSTLGAGLNDSVFALTVFDDGGGVGPALYAGGRFTNAGGTPANRVARWDGTSWSPLGSGLNGDVDALAVYDDGSGPALFAGGEFTSAGGVAANRIAKWNGTSWSPLASGIAGSTQTVAVFALAVHDAGDGPELYAGGLFASAGGVAAKNVARWDGASWMPLGAGTTGRVLALTVFDDGNGGGSALYAGGKILLEGAVQTFGLARWDGSAWSAVGSGVDDTVSSLEVFDDGSGAGPALYAGGFFHVAGDAPAEALAKWDGSQWSPLANGTNAEVLSLAVFDAGAGAALYAGGAFGVSPAGDSYLARWQGCPDAEPPAIDCPAVVFALDPLDGPPGELVSFTVTVDDRDPHATLVCVPPSGSFFPRGTTLVTCTATDGSGNQSSRQFPVNVWPKARPR